MAIILVKKVTPTSTRIDFTTDKRVLTALLCLPILKISSSRKRRKTRTDLASTDIIKGNMKGTIARRSMIPKNEKA